MVVVLLVFSSPSIAKAEEEIQDPDLKNDGMIEIHYPPTITEPYRERRSDWSYQFSANSEYFLPTKFISFKDGLTYEELFGKTNISLYQIALGTKYNFMLGALTLDLLAANGKVESSRSGTPRSLSIMKKAIALGWTLDAIMQEPYVAPYIQGQFFDFEYGDNGAADGNSSGRTAWTTGYTAGLLIQLNFWDPTDTALVANSQFGLNNTYIDIFATQYNTSNASDDPQLQSSLNWGAGVRLEF